MNTEPIIFRSGEENGIVIERDNFKNSIFMSQYQQALKTFCHIWTQQKRYLDDKNQPAQYWTKYGVDNLFANVIAFCGDRGEGKSSSMISFTSILTEEGVRQNAVKSIELDDHTKEKLSQIKTEKIELLGVIDPSFFDHEHNLLELLLGRMHSNITKEIERQEKDTCSNTYTRDHRQIMELFQKVKSCMKILEKGSNIYDELENLNDLAAGINLQENLYKLFECYSAYMHKERLVVCIDDIDLNVQEGYKMAELLRKYLLTCPHLIVLVAVKIDQLEDVIANAHKMIFNNDKISWDDCLQMARKYTAKLLPRGNRVLMPSFGEISDRDLIIIDEIGKERSDRAPVKESVVQMIFQKTGYVFYNTRYLSPIIPRNLRSLRHLLATLISLPDARDENWDDDETGREVFKDYFFGTWVENNLKDSKDLSFAQKIATYNDISTLNAFVVEHIANRVSNIDMKNASGLNANFIDLYKSIIARNNTAANISYGDVMYVLWMINSATTDVDVQNLIFFIKTIYSMRIYAYYNVISETPSNEERKNNLYPPTPNVQKEVHIHQADRWYEHVNRLQRLLNGGYFTYPQGGLLPMSEDKQYRDRKTISFKVVKNWLMDIKELYNKETYVLREENTLLLNACELMALYIVRTTTKDEKEKDLGYNRTAKVPSHLWQYSTTAHYAIIDFLQPFYSLCNVEYAYRRFDTIMGADEDEAYSLYNIALNTEKSLLRQLYDCDSNNVPWPKQHNLISDAVIRVADVQWAIFDELLRRRDLHKSKDEVIPAAYRDIQNLQIKLYPLNREDNPEKNAWILPFRFLSVLASCFSKDYDIDKGKDKTIKVAAYTFIQEKLNEVFTLDGDESNETKSEMPEVWAKMYSTLRRKQWPKPGKRVRSYVSAAANLPKGQQAILTANLRSVFDDNKDYTFEELNSLMPNILAQYYIVQSSNK